MFLCLPDTVQPLDYLTSLKLSCHVGRWEPQQTVIRIAARIWSYEPDCARLQSFRWACESSEH